MRPFISAKSVVLQRRRVGQRALGVGVLGFEIGADLGLEHGGVAHHLLPVVGAQPSVIVDQLDAVTGPRSWAAVARPGEADG